MDATVVSQRERPTSHDRRAGRNVIETILLNDAGIALLRDSIAEGAVSVELDGVVDVEEILVRDFVEINVDWLAEGILGCGHEWSVECLAEVSRTSLV